MSAKRQDQKRSSAQKSIRKEGSVISMTFEQAKESSGKPLDLAKQRAIPQIQQEVPIESMKADCDMRNDVVDYTVSDTVQENRNESITNPVEIQNRKRLR